MLECVVNLSEGRRRDLVDELASVAGDCVLDVHADPWHNRSVVTLAGPGLVGALRALATEAVARLDLREHDGVHPRIGVVDVVPFCPVGPGAERAPLDEAVEARDHFARWAGEVLSLPCFLYGPERSLPEVRRRAWRSLAPDTGPPAPDERSGAACVGARHPLVAYNCWLASSDLSLAKRVASTVRRPEVRTLGLNVGGSVQVSCNLLDPVVVGPGAVFDAIASLAPVERAELVGLLPRDVLDREPPSRWEELDLREDRTVEHRLAART